MAVNTRSTELVMAPQPIGEFLGSSPDGAWWLFGTLDFSADAKDRLIVFHPETGKVVVLADKVLLGHHGGYWERFQYCSWSPLVH